MREPLLPSIEQSKKLIDAALAFRALAPWEWMDDRQLFAVENKSNGDAGYCVVLGNNGEVFGLVVYRGREALERFYDIHDGAIDYSDPNTAFVNNSLNLFFVPRSELDKNDKEIIRRSGKEVRGQKCPQFQSYLPGLVPWNLSGEEADFLFDCITVACKVGVQCKTNPMVFGLGVPNRARPILTYAIDATNGIWNSSFQEPPALAEKTKRLIMPNPVIINELQSFTRIAQEWILDSRYVRAPIDDKSSPRPYFPQAAIVVESESLFVLATNLGPGHEVHENLLKAFADAARKHSKLPSGILFTNESQHSLMRPIFQDLAIPTGIIDDTDEIDDIYGSLEEFFSKQK